MCSLNDYEYNDNDSSIQDSIKEISADILCRKCKCENVDILLLNQSGYCKECFLIVTNHKFRAALGKSKIIRHGDSVLVDYSGDLNSTVLLHLIKIGMSELSYKKLIFKTTILYIDFDRTNEDRDILKHKIIQQTKSFGFDCYIISLSEALNEENMLNIKSIDSQWTNNENNSINDEQLHEILDKLADDSSRIDLLDQLHRKLLVSAARKLNCNKVFVSDSATDVAVNVLGNTCLGRGAQLSTLAAFCDDRCVDIKILKPIRDFTQQEILYYSKCHALNPVKLKMTDAATQPTSIQALAHNFTIELESQFSSTVSTIYRTADKLSTRSSKDNQDTEENCVLCDIRLGFVSPNGKISALRAIEVSKLVSSKHINAKTSLDSKESNCKNPSLNDQKCCNDNVDECCKNIKSLVTSEDVWKCLCYSCKQIFRNTDIVNTFPTSLLLKVQQKLALENMRKEIDDFLL